MDSQNKPESAEPHLLWIPFYKSLASKLLKYKEKEERKKLVEEIHGIATRAPALSPSVLKDKFKDGTEDPLRDICPFTTIAIFNRNQTNENRKKIATELANFLDVKEQVPSFLEVGIPTVDSRRTWFFAYEKDRDPHDIDMLWEVFEKAINFADSNTEDNKTAFIVAYNNASEIKGVNWNLTMGLFWIRPITFPTLDGNSKAYMEKELGMKALKKLPDASEYLKIGDMLKANFKKKEAPVSSFPNLSFISWATKLIPKRSELHWPTLKALQTTEMSVHYKELSKQVVSDLNLPDSLNSVLSKDGRRSVIEYEIAWALYDLQQIDVAMKKGKGHWRVTSLGQEISSEKELLQQLHGAKKSIPSSPSQPSSFKPKTNAKNLILYGPPGTGKTYKLNKLKQEYSGGTQTLNRKAWLIQELQEASWFEVIFAALYNLGRKEKVSAISEHEYVQAKAESVGRVKHVKNTIWSVLQLHAPEGSESVRFKNRGQHPAVFDKNESSFWSLVNDWEEECKDIVELSRRWKSGPDQESANERFEFVTFHQAYSYEDFIEGLRPVQDEETGNIKYEIVPGVFKRICSRAKADPEQRYAIFIDEINRGNIASIFGELITLIEMDKRVVYGEDGSPESGMTLTLPYSGERFGVPANLDVYGTMNTADRSIALIDTALRRRFQFREMMPNTSVINGSSDNGLIEDGKGGTIDLRRLLEAINSRIRFLLSRDMTIGHSYLINVQNFDDLKNALYTKIIPLLQEYFYDDWHRIQLVFRDVRANGEKLEPQIISHVEMKEEEIIGFDHADFEDSTEYSVTPEDEITPDAIRKVYEENNT